MPPTPDIHLVELISKRLQVVNSRIEDAAITSGRSVQEIQLITVSKRQPIEVILAAYEVGLKTFGENYTEEAVEKMQALGELKGLRWEMIGHIQSRKAKLAANNFARVHSLDSEKLARLLSQFREPGSKSLEVLLEINISGEESKGGLPGWTTSHWEALLPFIEMVNLLPGIKITGLMTMPPFVEYGEENRIYFGKLRELKSYINQHIPQLNLKELSMGTSIDYQVAVEEGATILRIGEALLGPRIY